MILKNSSPLFIRLDVDAAAHEVSTGISVVKIIIIIKVWCIESVFTGLSVIQQSICVGTSQDYVQAKRDLSWWKNFDYPKLDEKNSWQTIEKMFWKPGRGMCLWERPLSSGKIWMNIDIEGSYPCIVWKWPTKVLSNLDDIRKGLNIWISQDALLLVHGFVCQILDCGWFVFFINTVRWK